MKLSTLAFAASAVALDIQWDSRPSIIKALNTVSKNMLSYYKGDEPGEVPGLLPGALACNPNNEGNWCWWQSGAMFGSLINYRQYTGDESNDKIISEAIQFQRGANNDFNPSNQSRSMGIDDQGFWGFTALDAVEANFPESTKEGDPSFLTLAQGLFNFQIDHWDDQTCGGGFRWQVFFTNPGYNLKNMISNGGFFQLAARLHYITEEQEYADWAEKSWEWIEQSVMWEEADDGILYLWDNTDADLGCKDATRYVWTYNYGVLLGGAAYMYNVTNGDQLWKTRIDKILDSTYKLFFPAEKGGNIMVEYLCEEDKLCNQDQKSFKAYLSRWMAVTALLAPYTYETIHPKMVASAQGAAAQCAAGPDGESCGSWWFTTTFSGKLGVGEQMSAMAVIGASLITDDMVPLSKASGAESTSDVNAGGEKNNTPTYKPITTGDKAGAAILTMLVIGGIIGGGVWLMLE